MSKVLFNDNWKFVLKDIGTPLADIENETGWHDIEVPHDWLIGDTAHLYETGEGWYKKSFNISNYRENKSYIICFDGVYMNSTVYINGKEAGTWKYGYSSFDFDISELVHEGENTVYVRVCHEAPNTRWYSGAGIYRNVYFRTTSRIHIRENGVYIVTKQSGNKWLVLVETELTYGGCTVRHTVLNKEGSAVARLEEAAEGNVSAIKLVAQSPSVWDINNPYCYILRTELVLDGVVLDRVENEFGFRTTEFSPSEGFKLNGKRLKLHGVCMHHDLGALGAAVNIHALKRQLEILKSYGVNAVRTSHNMPARELISLCNNMGILVVNEGFDMWEMPKNSNDYARFFNEWCEKDVKAWVERDRNAPCVIMWSIGNEIPDTNGETGLPIAKRLTKAVHKHDRFQNAVCTIGSNYMRWAPAQSVADHMKIAGYNYTEDIYDEHHEKHPDWFIYGSETASTVRSRGIYHYPASVSMLTHEDMQCSDYGNSVVGWGKNQEKAWIDDRDREYCGGQFVWTGFDYIGEPTPYSTKNSYFGIVDTAGFPKDSYYLYKAVWTDSIKEPFIHILPYWDFNAGEEIDVFVYSNVETIELFFNDTSLGKQYIDLKNGKTLHGEWKIPYRRGMLTAYAYDESGRIIADCTISSFYDAVSIEAVPDKTAMLADGRDIVFIEISVKDDLAVTVENARNRINVTVDGPARLVGLDNGDSTDYDSYKGMHKRLFSGKLLAMIQSTFDSGKVTVNFESKGLISKSVELESVACERPVGISVVKEQYPVAMTEYKPENPLRKIELKPDRRLLDKENPSSNITVRYFPEDADYKDIEWKCVLDTGVEVGYSEIEKTDNGVIVKALGDGTYKLRAICRNGGEIPQIISDITMTNEGFGSALQNPYTFCSASLYGFSNKPLNVVERGAVSGLQGRTVIGFENVDFGKFGSDMLILHCGHCYGDKPIAIELWSGDPDSDGRKIDMLMFENNGRWEGFVPQLFKLTEKLSGVQKIAFVVNCQIIFGGFEFEMLNKAYERITAGEHDGLYGDDYKITGSSITGIGNNVLIYFNGMDFKNGVDKITVCGKTPNEVNTIQLRYNDDNGVQQTQLLKFPYSYEDTEVTFPLERIEGTRDISFVFLPGSKFDFNWFRFE